MNCKYCNVENPDEAKFCLSCGNKLTGINCPSCGADNDEQAVLCEKCGGRLDGKRNCTNCGAEIPDDFTYCIACGKEVKERKSINDDDFVKPTASNEKATNILRTVAYSLAIAIAALSIIFTVFMGGKLANATLLSLITEMENVECDVFYYMGKVWENLATTYSSIGGVETVKTMAYLQAGLGLLFSVATIITVLTLSIMAIVRCVNSLNGKYNRGGRLAVGSFIAYATGATALLMLNVVYVDVESQYLSAHMHYVFNDVTVAGLAVCGTLVGLYAVFAILSNGTKQLNKPFIVNGSLSLGSIVLTVIISALFALPLITLLNESLYGSSMKEGINHFYLIQQAAVLADRQINMEENGNGIIIAMLAIFAFIATCYALVRTLCITGTQIKNVTSGDSNKMQSVLGLSIEVLCVSTVALILTIVSYQMLAKETSSLYDDISVSYAPLIAIVVLNALNLGVEIARKIVKTKFN